MPNRNFFLILNYESFALLYCTFLSSYYMCHIFPNYVVVLRLNVKLWIYLGFNMLVLELLRLKYLTTLHVLDEHRTTKCPSVEGNIVSYFLTAEHGDPALH